jgi:hypothetical protein
METVINGIKIIDYYMDIKKFIEGAFKTPTSEYMFENLIKISNIVNEINKIMDSKVPEVMFLKNEFVSFLKTQEVDYLKIFNENFTKHINNTLKYIYAVERISFDNEKETILTQKMIDEESTDNALVDFKKELLKQEEGYALRRMLEYKEGKIEESKKNSPIGTFSRQYIVEKRIELLRKVGVTVMSNFSFEIESSIEEALLLFESKIQMKYYGKALDELEKVLIKNKENFLVNDKKVILEIKKEIEGLVNKYLKKDKDNKSSLENNKTKDENEDENVYEILVSNQWQKTNKRFFEENNVLQRKLNGKIIDKQETNLTKETLESMLKKYGKTKIKLVEEIDEELAGKSVSSNGLNVVFDIENEYLVIEDELTEENILMYYKYLDAETLNNAFSVNAALRLEGVIKYRSSFILPVLFGFENNDVLKEMKQIEKNVKYNKGFHCIDSVSYFGIKDDLEDENVNILISKIQKTEEYKLFIKENKDKSFEHVLINYLKNIIKENKSKTQIEKLLRDFYEKTNQIPNLPTNNKESSLAKHTFVDLEDMDKLRISFSLNNDMPTIFTSIDTNNKTTFISKKYEELGFGKTSFKKNYFFEEGFNVFLEDIDKLLLNKKEKESSIEKSKLFYAPNENESDFEEKQKKYKEEILSNKEKLSNHIMFVRSFSDRAIFEVSGQYPSVDMQFVNDFLFMKREDIQDDSSIINEDNLKLIFEKGEIKNYNIKDLENKVETKYKGSKKKVGK